ncbi:MAG TPA: uracil-DNA glycosylase [Candidatus Udaeobacter sp.]|nr:uracil-DNA glycosylase [Candidatus Udaeobacter sp.]
MSARAAPRAHVATPESGAAEAATPARTAARSTLVSLERRIVACELCPRLREHCTAVAREKRRAFRDQTYWGRPIPGFGDPGARLLVVGLAPAAHGANRTGRMFTGDSSGDWLYAALHVHGFANQPRSETRDDGLRLTGVWITAAARCAPPDNRPSRDELALCRTYLEEEIATLTRVRVVVTLGAIAHEAWLRASGWWPKPESRPPFAHGRETALPNGIVLISSYHPSRQNTQTGRLSRAAWNAIFARARERVDAVERDGAR